MTPQALTHIGICVSSLEESRKFYCDGLGFKPVTRFAASGTGTETLVELENVDLHCIFIERDAVRIELMEFVQPGHSGSTGCEPMNNLGLTHLAFRVTDVGQTIEQLENLGGQPMPQTHSVNPEAGSEVAFLMDPNGVRIELINLPGEPKAPLGIPCD